MKSIRIFVMAAFVAVFASSASAQNSQLNASATVFDTVTTQWVVDLFNEMGFSANIVAQSESSDQIEVTAPSGGIFYVAVRGCDTSTPKKCMLVQPYALFDSSGVTLSDINGMMRDNFAISYAFLSPDNKGTIASKVYTRGGVTKGNVIQELAGYFYDLDNLIEAISTGTKADISFESSSRLSGVDMSKIGNSIMLPRDLFVNEVGASAPKFMLENLRGLVE